MVVMVTPTPRLDAGIRITRPEVAYANASARLCIEAARLRLY